MYKILIDSSKRYEKKIELLKDGEVLDTISGNIDVVVEIENILKKNGVGIKDVELFDPYLGPGSFTGLKIGVTVANVLNWALKKKTLSELKLPAYGNEPNIQL